MRLINPAPDTAEPAPRWQDQAECRRPEYARDRDLWYSDRNTGDIGYAVDICKSLCPVRAACAQFALQTREAFGIWGGLTARQRRSILRREAREQTAQRKAAA
ncbi:WhiB family transcriptional regulator [Streptomyces sp. NPDC050439]|uniref:WhiB family transcriptional regulator n=1 Tax=unclassified Streptomyces TaxID=2593676 RepID=UPI0034456AFC